MSNRNMRFTSFVWPAIFSASIAHGQTFTNSASDGKVSINGRGHSVVMIDGRVVSGGKAVEALGPAVNEERQISPYTAVRLSAPVEFHYVVSARPTMRIIAAANILPLVKTSVQAGELRLTLDSPVTLREPLRVVASGPNLTFISLDGSGRIRVKDLSSPHLQINISGSGDVIASGEVETFKLIINGSGTADTTSLHSSFSEVFFSGSGKARVYSSRSINIESSGSGSLTVIGEPADRKVISKGTGKIIFK